MKYLAVVLIFILGSCEPNSNPDHKSKTITSEWGLTEVEFDGCQYIIFQGYKKGGLTHKANCSNH